MENKFTIELKKRPSNISTLFHAYNSRKSRFNSMESIPRIHVKKTDLRISRLHLNSFNTICAIDPTPGLHILYPFTLVYPYLMRLLCRKEMPFSMFKTLNTKNRIRMFRTINPDERFQIDCYNTEIRILPKGVEFDFKADLYSANKKIWENTATYYLQVKSDIADSSYVQAELEPLKNSSTLKEWFLDEKFRFKFAMISGDTNGIHYSSLYARMFGFKRDFAQPIRIISKCVSSLTAQPADQAAELDFFIKGPVYYKKMLTLRNKTKGSSHRFDLYCEGNERPCICAELIPIKAD